MKGKIIVIDNQMEETRNLIVKENYVLAHTKNLKIGKYQVGDRMNNQLDVHLSRQLSQVQSTDEKVNLKDFAKLIKTANDEQKMIS